MARNILGLFTKVFAGSAEPSERQEFGTELGDIFEQGWDSEYSTPSSGKYPRRKEYNDLFAKLTAMGVDINAYGAALPWDALLEYSADAVVTYNGTAYQCILATSAGDLPTNATYFNVLALGQAELDLKADLDGANVALGNTALRSALDIAAVDNTSDANKPVSTDAQTALDLKSDKADGVNIPSYESSGVSVINLTLSQVRGQLFGVAAVATVNMPDSDVGMSIQILDISGNVVTIYPASGEAIFLGDTALDPDQGIISTGTRGDTVKLRQLSYSLWFAESDSFTAIP